MFAYKIVKQSNISYKIAEIEKAVLDFFYINTHLNSGDDFFELRINLDEFKLKVDVEKIKKYLLVFDNKSLEKRVRKFLKYINVKS